jgi:hypothetical protein
MDYVTIPPGVNMLNGTVSWIDPEGKKPSRIRFDVTNEEVEFYTGDVQPPDRVSFTTGTRVVLDVEWYRARRPSISRCIPPPCKPLTNDAQLAKAREAQTKLYAAVEACEALVEFERCNACDVSLAFNTLSRQQVDRWNAFLNDAVAGTRTV